MRRPSIPDLLWRLMVSAMVAGLVLLALAVPASGAVGPKLVKDINPTGNSFPTNLTRVGSKLFFAASDGVHGNELWVSDGTTAGTRMVKNIKPGAKSSNPEMLVNVNGTLFFLASDGTHGEQLWKSDGTKAGTVMVPESAVYATDMRPACPGYPYYPPVVAGNRLFYFLSGGGCVLSVTLYVSDGTPAGTHYLDAPVSTNLGDEESGRRVAAALGNKLYFVVENWELDYASDIWVSDGTDAGTHRMAGSPTNVLGFLPVQGRNLYFVTGTGDWYYPDDVQIWKTDGTKRGTKPLTSIGELHGSPTEAAYMAKRLYFTTHYWDASKHRYYAQLWRSDGTASGTDPAVTTKGYSAMRSLTAAGGWLFYTIDRDLWRSDGTAAGTTDLGPVGAQWPRDLIAVGSELCFAEMDGDAGTWSLWDTDGTTPGTYQVGTFAGSPYDPLPKAAVGNRLFFAANDIAHGMELWSYKP
jgi:ELWxxDGT repeat protein